ncbi:hypothetical protein [Bacillus massilinigeriensis]|uniref:hypothetical protein n=1 Tax=Bacillus massilionigeriensis TaxID=1805475 RepID=UPI00096B0488|nr:hypothetical protein [Bacillus massilionigeriensis]
MKQVVNSLKMEKKEKERRAVLRLELDYELATLFDAIQENNEDQKNLSKQKLIKIRQELLRLKAL